MLENIHIVLIGTSHPGNIGSAARAMKTMGLTKLFLVEPKLFPHPKAIEMAAGAADIVENAVVFSNLEDAIADSHLVIGSSVRLRTIPWPLVTPRELGELVGKEAKSHQIAILFGREQAGLTNEELQRCHYHVQIPSDAHYGSLNVAAAVQVIAYELRLAFLNESPPVKWDYPLATEAEMEGFYEHFEGVLIEIGFLDPAVPRQLMTRLRRLFTRTRPDVMEVNILRGILGHMRKGKFSR